jgi:hypothetical protein
MFYVFSFRSILARTPNKFERFIKTALSPLGHQIHAIKGRPETLYIKTHYII